MTLLSRAPTYVTTYISGAQKANSRSQLATVDSGAVTMNGPMQCPLKTIMFRVSIPNQQQRIPLRDIYIS